LSGASSHTSLLLFTYAAGAATSLAVALLAGRRVFTALKKSLHASEWLRRALGAGVLVAVAAIALGVDTGFLTRLSLARTSSLEERLVARLGPSPSPKAAGQVSEAGTGSSMGFPVEGELPPLEGAVDWLNSRPLTAADLKGKVVLVDFWTYSCINCLRSLPYIRAWAEKYGSQGLVVIGVHAPEFAFEKNIANVKAALADLQVHYPVAIDNNYAIWRAFGNQYWPAHYFADAQGRIRHHHFGEGEYDESERVIQELLAEAGKTRVDPTLVAVKGTGAEAPPASKDVASPETYLGYERAAGFSSPTEALPDRRQTYVAGKPALNEWSLSGPWTIGSERVLLDAPGGGIVYRFHARDLHLVLGPGPAGKPIRFKVRIDGEAPADSHGVDTDAAGEGRVTGERLYQLVRQRGPIKDRTFEIRFQDPGVEAFAFTFG
jgi:thiol-disulfide isomerase/thioredoxin